MLHLPLSGASTVSYPEWAALLNQIFMAKMLALLFSIAIATRFAQPHPLPWLVEILNGVEHANFFEQRATEYSKGASRGTWDGEDGVWAAFDRVTGQRAAQLGCDV